MEFGVCTNFAAPVEDPAGIGLIPRIAQAGFNYVELPLCEAAALSPSEFSRLKQVIRDCGLTAPVACNLFPGDLCLRGGGEDPEAIRAYLERALDRAEELGLRKVVFASVSAWNTEGNREDARKEIIALVGDLIAPAFQRRGIRVLIEGIRRQVSNVINTVPEAADIVARANHPSCGLMADLFHMLSNGEPTENLTSRLPSVEHIHIAELDRRLPSNGCSPALEMLVRCLETGAWQGSVSFEARGPFTSGELRKARETIENILK